MDVGFRAVVVDVRQERGARWQLLLDRTEFGASDSGQLEAAARSGVRLRVPVLAVVVDGTGAVWHVVEKPLAAGTEVEARVDVRGRSGSPGGGGGAG